MPEKMIEKLIDKIKDVPNCDSLIQYDVEWVSKGFILDTLKSFFKDKLILDRKELVELQKKNSNDTKLILEEWLKKKDD